MESRSANPTDASPVGSAIVYSAPGPVTMMPPLRSARVIGRVPASFLSSTAPSSDISSATAASPFLVPRLAAGVAPCAGRGSRALPLRSPLIPPGLVQLAATGVWSQPSMPNRCSWYSIMARPWLNTDSGTDPLATACTSVQPVAGQPVPGTPATWTAFGAEQDTALPDASAQVSPVGSNADGGPKKPPPELVLRLLLSLK